MHYHMSFVFDVAGEVALRSGYAILRTRGCKNLSTPSALAWVSTCKHRSAKSPGRRRIRSPPQIGSTASNSDRGAQYISIKYSARLAKAGIEPSDGNVGIPRTRSEKR
jgi:transposase InsO family protein